jgi:hypothetical protein
LEYVGRDGVSPSMTLPTVTEIVQRPEHGTRDPFIASLPRTGPVPRRIGT